MPEQSCHLVSDRHYHGDPLVPMTHVITDAARRPLPAGLHLFLELRAVGLHALPFQPDQATDASPKPACWSRPAGLSLSI